MAKRLIGSTAGSSADISTGDLGAPGSHSVLIIEAVFRNRPPSNWERDTEQREFVVSAILCRTPLSPEDLNLALEASLGSSYFVVPENTTHMQMGVPGGVFDLSINEAREISYVEFNTLARNWQQASDAFYLNFGSILNHLSYQFNVPVWIGRLVTRDAKHEVQFLEYYSPHVPVQLPQTINQEVHSEMDPIYALYREALNAQSPHYRMLCFYKILEGIFGSLRPRVRRRATKAGVLLEKQEECIPSDQDIPDRLNEWVGKSVTEFYNKVLTRQFRDSVAHFTLRDTRVLHLGRPDHVRAFAEIVRACEICARVVIANHERDLSQLNAALSTAKPGESPTTCIPALL